MNAEPDQRFEFPARAFVEIRRVDVKVEIIAVGLAARDGEARAQKKALWDAVCQRKWRAPRARWRTLLARSSAVLAAALHTQPCQHARSWSVSGRRAHSSSIGPPAASIRSNSCGDRTTHASLIVIGGTP